MSRRGDLATVEVSGTAREISLYLLPDEAAVGDYVLVHAGFAIRRLDPEAARESLEFLRGAAGEPAD